jgi:hypothetical protein
MPAQLRFALVTAATPAGAAAGGTAIQVRLLDRELEPQGEPFAVANLADAAVGAVVLVADHGDGEAGKAAVAVVEGGLVRGGI